MIWNRREFLQTMLLGVIATALPKIAISEIISTPIFHPEQDFWIMDIFATGKSSEVKTPAILKLTRGQPNSTILQFSFNPQGWFRWVAVPGEEICGRNLVNESSEDLDVQFVVRQNDKIFQLNRDGSFVYVDLKPINDNYREDEDELEYRSNHV